MKAPLLQLKLDLAYGLRAPTGYDLSKIENERDFASVYVEIRYRPPNVRLEHWPQALFALTIDQPSDWSSFRLF